MTDYTKTAVDAFATIASAGIALLAVFASSIIGLNLVTGGAADDIPILGQTTIVSAVTTATADPVVAIFSFLALLVVAVLAIGGIQAVKKVATDLL